jgi:hypothetical protein
MCFRANHRWASLTVGQGWTANRVTPDRQSGLENDVWARLAGGAHLRILVAIRVLGSECHEFIWSEQDDHSLRGGARQ